MIKARSAPLIQTEKGPTSLGMAATTTFDRLTFPLGRRYVCLDLSHLDLRSNFLSPADLFPIPVFFLNKSHGRENVFSWLLLKVRSWYALINMSGVYVLVCTGVGGVILRGMDAGGVFVC